MFVQVVGRFVGTPRYEMLTIANLLLDHLWKFDDKHTES